MRLSFLLEYAFVRLFEAALWPLPWEASSAFGAAIGRLIPGLLRRRWRMTLDNIRDAFPEMPEPERLRIARAVWENAGRFGAELARVRHMTPAELSRIMHFENPELLRGVQAEGKGVLVNIGHMGNWEVAGQTFTAQGFKIGGVGRAMKNPLVDRWLGQTRSRFGFRVFAHKNPFFQSARWLKQGELLAVLIDHNIRRGGLFVPFFGRPAATSTLSALLAVKLDAPIVSCRVRRDGARFSARFDGPLRPDPAAPFEAEVQRLTLEMTRQLEDYVREKPEDWLWGHNRWRRTPEAGETVLPLEAAR